MTYNPNIPLPTDLISDSQAQIKANFGTANTSFGIDHFPFDNSTANNGYHKVIHTVPQGSNPVAVSGVDEIFSKNYTPNTTGGVADTQQYHQSGLGVVSQLTGKLTGIDGWCWAGGLLFQWGIVSLSTGSGNPKQGTVIFKDRVAGAIPFTTCYNVQMTLASSSGTSSANTISYVGSLSPTQFKWNFTGTTSYTEFFWFAIGV